jgi:hypothetical protein
LLVRAPFPQIMICKAATLPDAPLNGKVAANLGPVPQFLLGSVFAGLAVRLALAERR